MREVECDAGDNLYFNHSHFWAIHNDPGGPQLSHSHFRFASISQFFEGVKETLKLAISNNLGREINDSLSQSGGIIVVFQPVESQHCRTNYSFAAQAESLNHGERVEKFSNIFRAMNNNNKFWWVSARVEWMRTTLFCHTTNDEAYHPHRQCPLFFRRHLRPRIIKLPTMTAWRVY